MEKKRNLWVIPTDKPSRLVRNSENILKLCIQTLPIDVEIHCYPQNIYITNSDEIKEGDYCIHGNRLHKHLGKKCLDVLTNKEYTQSTLINKDSVFKKIILTTDKDLIKDGVEAIDDEFLEWFVKNPSCESVKFTDSKTVKEHIWDGTNDGEIIWEKEIITPQKPKQETLEDVVVKRINDNVLLELHHSTCYSFAEIGAKWQQEQDKKMYSEEEVFNLIEKAIEDKYANLRYWFEQFKKKYKI
jgi:hypothetical protein